MAPDRICVGAIGGALLLSLMTELLRNFGEWRLMVYSVA